MPYTTVSIFRQATVAHPGVLDNPHAPHSAKATQATVTGPLFAGMVVDNGHGASGGTPEDSQLNTPPASRRNSNLGSQDSNSTGTSLFGAGALNGKVSHSQGSGCVNQDTGQVEQLSFIGARGKLHAFGEWIRQLFRGVGKTWSQEEISERLRYAHSNLDAQLKVLNPRVQDKKASVDDLIKFGTANHNYLGSPAGKNDLLRLLTLIHRVGVANELNRAISELKIQVSSVSPVGILKICSEVRDTGRMQPETFHKMAADMNTACGISKARVLVAPYTIRDIDFQQAVLPDALQIIAHMGTGAPGNFENAINEESIYPKNKYHTDSFVKEYHKAWGGVGPAQQKSVAHIMYKAGIAPSKPMLDCISLNIASLPVKDTIRMFKASNWTAKQIHQHLVAYKVPGYADKDTKTKILLLLTAGYSADSILKYSLFKNKEFKAFWEEIQFATFSKFGVGVPQIGPKKITEASAMNSAINEMRGNNTKLATPRDFDILLRLNMMVDHAARKSHMILHHAKQNNFEALSVVRWMKIADYFGVKDDEHAELFEDKSGKEHLLQIAESHSLTNPLKIYNALINNRYSREEIIEALKNSGASEKALDSLPKSHEVRSNVGTAGNTPQIPAEKDDTLLMDEYAD